MGIAVPSSAAANTNPDAHYVGPSRYVVVVDGYGSHVVDHSGDGVRCVQTSLHNYYGHPEVAIDGRRTA